MINHSLKTGFSFGLTSGIITSLGLIVGLYASTDSRLVVLAGILTIAIADAFSDALGIHISEESEGTHTSKEIWQSTISAFLTKFLCALTFAVPILLFSFSIAIIVSVIWGLILLIIFNFYLAKIQKKAPWKIIAEHLIIAFIVIVATHYLGTWINLIIG